MNEALPVTVVIVSRGRPDALARCLLGVSQLRYPNFEVVIVADKAGMARLWGMPEAMHAKLIRYDDANISYARNLGIIEAGGEAVASSTTMPCPNRRGCSTGPSRSNRRR